MLLSSLSISCVPPKVCCGLSIHVTPSQNTTSVLSRFPLRVCHHFLSLVCFFSFSSSWLSRFSSFPPLLPLSFPPLQTCCSLIPLLVLLHLLTRLISIPPPSCTFLPSHPPRDMSLSLPSGMPPHFTRHLLHTITTLYIRALPSTLSLLPSSFTVAFVCEVIPQSHSPDILLNTGTHEKCVYIYVFGRN